MCDLCDESPDGTVSCQDCGRLICFDTKGVDDICAPAYVTESGDLYCRPCGSRVDEEMRLYDEQEFGYMWEAYPGELLTSNEAVSDEDDLVFDDALHPSADFWEPNFGE